MGSKARPDIGRPIRGATVTIGVYGMESWKDNSSDEAAKSLKMASGKTDSRSFPTHTGYAIGMRTDENHPKHPHPDKPKGDFGVIRMKKIATP
jgi:hypothetical protein